MTTETRTSETRTFLPLHDEGGQSFQNFLGANSGWRDEHPFSHQNPFAQVTHGIIVPSNDFYLHVGGHAYDVLYNSVESAIRKGNLAVFWLFGEIAAAHIQIVNGKYKLESLPTTVNELNPIVRGMARTVINICYPDHEYDDPNIRWYINKEVPVKPLEILGILAYADSQSKTHELVMEMPAFADIDRAETYSSFSTGPAARKAELATFGLLRLLAATMKNPQFGQGHKEAIEKHLDAYREEIEKYGHNLYGFLLYHISEFILGVFKQDGDLKSREKSLESFWQISETLGPVYRKLIETGVLKGPTTEIDPSKSDEFIILFKH